LSEFVRISANSDKSQKFIFSKVFVLLKNKFKSFYTFEKKVINNNKSNKQLQKVINNYKSHRLYVTCREYDKSDKHQHYFTYLKSDKQ
jgi:hypothetical protein